MKQIVKLKTGKLHEMLKQVQHDAPHIVTSKRESHLELVSGYVTSPIKHMKRAMRDKLTQKHDYRWRVPSGN